MYKQQTQQYPDHYRRRVDIDPLLPSQLCMPVTLGVQTIISGTCRDLSSKSLQETMQALEAQAYFAGCKLLYSTMTSQEKSGLGQLGSAVAARPVLVPANFAQAIIGALLINTHCGPVGVKHSVVLFRRWLVMGLGRFPLGSRYRRSRGGQLMWKDFESKAWLDDQLHRFSTSDNVFGLECRRLIQQIELPDRDPIYEILNVEFAEYNDQELASSFNRFSELFASTYSVIIEAVTRCADIGSPGYDRYAGV